MSRRTHTEGHRPIDEKHVSLRTRAFSFFISYYPAKLQDSMEFVISGMKVGGLEGIYLIRSIVFMDEMRYIVYVYYLFYLLPIMGRGCHGNAW